MHRRWMCFVLIVGGAVGLSFTGCGSDDSSNGASPAGGVDGGDEMDAGREMDAATEAASDTSSEAGPGCVPHDVEGWTPPAPKRSAGHPGACTDEWTVQIVDDCLGPTATEASCRPWIGADADTAHKTCLNCVVTYDTDPVYGAVIGFPDTSVAYANVAGCIEVLANVTDCANKFQAWLGCHEEACAASWCPVSDSTSIHEWATCAQSSDQSTCASYLADYNSCLEQQAQGAGAICLTSPTDFVASSKAVAKVFCGGG